MKVFLASLFLLLGSTSIVLAAPEVLSGCQGEGCDCFRGYQHVSGKESRDFDIPVLRPFTLHKERSRTSQVLGKFEPGAKGRPLAQELLVEAKGLYIVKRVLDEKSPIKKSDRIDTVLSQGEGNARGRRAGKWVDFEFEKIVLDVAKKTIVTAWMSVTVNGITGYTPDQPFEKCLE